MARPKAPAKPPAKAAKPPVPERPHERRPFIPGFDDVIGLKLREIRGVIPRWQVAVNMTLGGQPHPRKAYLMARAEAEGLHQDLRDQLAKIVELVEDRKTSIHFADFVGVCEGLAVSPARVLEETGFARPALTVDDAVDGDPALSTLGKQMMRSYYANLLQDPRARA